MAKKKEASSPSANVETDKAPSGTVLKAAISQLQKKFGPEIVQWLSDVKTFEHNVVSTGSIGIDSALGIGGIARGRIYEVYGPESSGKSTFCYSILAEAGKMGLKGLYVDAEHSLDPRLVQKMGADNSNIILVRGYTGEQNADIAEALIGTGEIAICVVDSVASLLPTSEANLESFDDQTMGVHARLMSRVCRKLVPLAARTSTTIMFINQTRNKIGAYGDSEITTGGNALRFYSSGRIRLSGGQSKSSRILDGEGKAYGHRVKYDIVKNKLAAPYRTGEVDLIYGVGFSRSGELIDLGEELGVVDRTGAWFSFGDTKLGQGRDKAVTFLDSNKEVQDAVLAQMRNVLFLEEKKLTFAPPTDVEIEAALASEVDVLEAE
jgi:recombination protein RecA